MTRRKTPPIPVLPETEIKPASGGDDPLLAEMDKYVLDTLQDPGASARVKSTAAQIGLKLLMVKHKIIGDDGEGDFFKGS